MIPRLHLVTDDGTLRRRDFAARMEAALEAGGRRLALHLRGHGLEGRELFQAAMGALRVAADSGGLVLVNDRVDVALVAGAHGVHLGRRSVPAALARQLLPPGSRLGASVHGADEVKEALSEGVPDFLMAGTVFSTPSHPGEAGAGPERIREVGEAAMGIPVVAIGGITPDRVAGLLQAGAYGVAVVRGVWEAPDAARAVGRYLEELS